MFPIIRSRIDARALSRKLRTSLTNSEEAWNVGTDKEGRPMLSNGGLRIVLVPRTVRMLDAIHVYSDDTEIWLPVLARLRLRGAARTRLIQDASDHLAELEVKKARPRRSKKTPAA